MTLLELLSEGKVEEFNAQRGRRSAPDLFAADLADLNLTGVDLSGANLEKADLSGTDLTDAVLAKANLSGADFTGTKLIGVVALRSKWREAYLEEAVMDGGDFSGSDFTEATLLKCSGAGVSFRSCRFKAAELNQSKFPEVDFSEARVDKADFRGSTLNGARFPEVSMNAATFERCVLHDAEMPSVKAAGSSFAGANLQRVDLSRADLTGSDLVETDLREALLIEADLGEADVKGALFKGADLTRARLEGVAFAEDQLADATVDAGSGGELPSDEPGQVTWEDARAAVHGEHIAVFWENEETDGTLASRVVVLGPGDRFKGVAPAVPAPAELTLARAVVPWQDGFACLSFVERPGGFELSVTQIGLDGARGETQNHSLDYDPAVRPVVVGGDTVRVLGLGRRGPTLYGHELTDEGLELRFGSRASTARGLVGEVLVTRGGVVMPITAKGVGEPLTEPSDFDVRLASGARDPDGLVLAWLPGNQPGFRWARMKPGERPETQVIEPEIPVTSLTVGVLDGRAVAFYARELGGGQLGACGIFGQVLGEKASFEVMCDERWDIDDVKVVASQGSRLVLLATTLAEEVLLVEVKGTKGRILQALA